MYRNCKQDNFYLLLFLSLSIGVWWFIALAYIRFGSTLSEYLGPLTFTHPLMRFICFLPSLAGLLIYFLDGGLVAVIKCLSKILPRKCDFIWYLVLLCQAVIYWLFVRYGLVIFGLEVPKITYSIGKMFFKVITNYNEEIGILGSAFGWFGYLLPFLQSKIRNRVLCGVITGIVFGLWILPIYFIPSFATSSSWILYLMQMTIFLLFLSYVFNATKGNIFLYMYAFLLTGSGTLLQFYYFNAQTQFLQILFLIFATVITHLILKKLRIGQTLQVFPEFIS